MGQRHGSDRSEFQSGSAQKLSVELVAGGTDRYHLPATNSDCEFAKLRLGSEPIERQIRPARDGELNPAVENPRLGRIGAPNEHSAPFAPPSGRRTAVATL